MFLLNGLGIHVSFYAAETKDGVSLFHSGSTIGFTRYGGYASFASLRVSKYAGRWNI